MRLPEFCKGLFGNVIVFGITALSWILAPNFTHDQNTIYILVFVCFMVAEYIKPSIMKAI